MIFIVSQKNLINIILQKKFHTLDIKVADDGSAMLLMTQKREDESASELMVFRLTGF